MLLHNAIDWIKESMLDIIILFSYVPRLPITAHIQVFCNNELTKSSLSPPNRNWKIDTDTAVVRSAKDYKIPNR